MGQSLADSLWGGCSPLADSAGFAPGLELKLILVLQSRTLQDPAYRIGYQEGKNKKAFEVLLCSVSYRTQPGAAKTCPQQPWR